MTDDRPDLTKTEVRQGNSRKMNSRALIFGVIALVVLFALVFWFATATDDETATTTGAGTTIEEVPATEEGVGSELEELPTPAPVEDEAADAPAADAAPAEPAADAADDAEPEPAAAQ